MKANIKRRWIEALLSRKYKQGKEALRSTSDRFCCLGVLEDLYLHSAKREWEINESGEYTTPDGESDVLSPRCQRWAGLPDDNPAVVYKGEETSLAEMNDDGKRFATIAKVIKAHL